MRTRTRTRKRVCACLVTLLSRGVLQTCHPEGDAAHTLPDDLGQAFEPWHRAFMLLFENVLLLVDPFIGAAP